MSKVLVTGGEGFIGSHTVDRLVSMGHDVVVLDNLERQVHNGKIPSFRNSKARYIRGDIRNKKSWLKALFGVEKVIHLAGAVGVGQSFWQTRKYVDVNIKGTATLFEIIATEKRIRHEIEKIVVASSKSLYGEGAYVCRNHGKIFPLQRPIEQLEKKTWEVKCPHCEEYLKPIGIPESKPAQNLNPYALSKYATELLAMEYSYALSIPTVAFRYFNVYGPRQSLSNPYTGVLAIFLSRLKNGNHPHIFEDGNQMRDFIYVEDIARYNCLALDNGEGVMNLGSGEPTSLNSIVSVMKDLLGSSVESFVPGEFRPGDNRHDYADVELLRKTFGKSEFVKLRQGLEALIEWGKDATAVDMFEKEERERGRYLSK